MPNGGESGRQLDRLQDQVDATRTELGEVAEALNGLRELVTELVRRSGSEHREDRWQAKLGSLETRLGMMETTMRSEVERMRAAAGAVDALADEFKSTVGDTHSLVSLAADIGNRLDVLQALENEGGGAAQEITSSVSDRLERDANDREQRDRALADRIAETIAESRGAVADLADRLEHAEQTQSSVAEAISGIGGDLSGLRADLDASGETNRRTTSDALGVLSTELQAFERRLVEGNAQDTRLRDLLDLVAQVRAEQPQLAGRVDGVATEVAALQRTLSEPLASVDTIIERVDSLAAAMRDAIAGQPDLRPQLDQLAERLGAVHARLPDAAELGDRLAAEIAELRTSQPDYGEALQRLSAVVSALPTEQVDPTDALERVAAEVAELRNNQPNTDDVVARVRAELATLRDTLPDATVPAARAIELLADQSAVLADM